MPTFGESHEALLAEYRSLSDEEDTLWNVLEPELRSEAPDVQGTEADMERWAEVRRRRVELDRVFDALVRRAVAEVA